ncbi:MAG: hypothetical protein WCY05_07675 [Candidatus Omnitrophota bacterium]
MTPNAMLMALSAIWNSCVVNYPTADSEEILRHIEALQLIIFGLKGSVSITTKEELAALAHECWSQWMEYMFSRCEFKDDGTAVIPKELVERWNIQMRTSFTYLRDEAKISALVEAEKILRVVLNQKD